LTQKSIANKYLLDLTFYFILYFRLYKAKLAINKIDIDRLDTN